MRRDWKKTVATLLAASMIFTMNTAALADEIPAEATLADTFSEYDEAELAEANLSTPGDPWIDPSTAPQANVKQDPKKWSTDPKYARFTYCRYLPGLNRLSDHSLVSGDAIYNGKLIKVPAMNGSEYMSYDEETRLLNGQRISFNCIDVGSDNLYVIYAYGIVEDEFKYENYEPVYETRTKYKTVSGNREEDGTERVLVGYYASPSYNGYYGMDKDNIPAGVFDYTPFTWWGKSGSAKANGRIIYEAAVVKWSKDGEAPVKQYQFEVGNVKAKNNTYATVSFNMNKDGEWDPINKNIFWKKKGTNAQPYFYPVFRIVTDDKGKAKKNYYAPNEKNDWIKTKVTKDDKKMVKTINKKVKNEKIDFEIRRRPIAGTTSGNYTDDDGHTGNPYKYASLMGDELDFTKKGKLKSATLQFKSVTSTLDKNEKLEEEETKEGSSQAGKNNTTAKASGYYLTHTLTMTKLNSSGQSNKELEEKLKKGEYKLSTKTDSWYKTESLAGQDVLIVFGANNMEGVAAFRKRADKTIGAGYYKDDKHNFITGIEK